MLSALSFRSGGGFRAGLANLTRKPAHFQSAQPRVTTFVPALEPGAINRLLERVARQDAKHDGHSRIELRELHATRYLARDVIEMRRLAAQHASNRNNCVTAAGLSHFLRHQRNFE